MYKLKCCLDINVINISTELYLQNPSKLQFLLRSVAILKVSGLLALDKPFQSHPLIGVPRLSSHDDKVDLDTQDPPER